MTRFCGCKRDRGVIAGAVTVSVHISPARARNEPAIDNLALMVFALFLIVMFFYPQACISAILYCLFHFSLAVAGGDLLTLHTL
jgi:hypothetical protein